MAEDRFDVLVIGGGITGAGIALDAVTRGFSVALVEKDDFAAGTSGRSSRLIHGGLRYLEHGEFGLVQESLRERAILRRLAPHLVRPVPMYMSGKAAATARGRLSGPAVATVGPARRRAPAPPTAGTGAGVGVRRRGRGRGRHRPVRAHRTLAQDPAAVPPGRPDVRADVRFVGPRRCFEPVRFPVGRQHRVLVREPVVDHEHVCLGAPVSVRVGAHVQVTVCV
jgi:hypothetical protein